MQQRVLGSWRGSDCESALLLTASLAFQSINASDVVHSQDKRPEGEVVQMGCLIGDQEDLEGASGQKL